MTNQTAGENPLKVFGAMLAYYRNRVGMTPEQLGARVYLSGSQIRKVEAGTRTLSEDLAKACEAIPELGCNGALTELYEILSEHLNRRAYPGWFAGWPDKEAQARRLRWFEPLVVPGLLQTETYARAILSTRMGATREELDEAVAARMQRQRVLGREHPPELWVILDEAVLRRPVGGPGVMREQLTYLTEAAQRPNIAIQVIPFGAGAHEGLRGGAFIVADFDGAATIAYQDAASSGQIIEDAADVEGLAVTWDTLRLDALPRASSVSLITSFAEAVLPMKEIRWRKSTYSSNGGASCVEVGQATSVVAVRDTKQNGAGPVLRFTPAAWRRFAEQVKRSLGSDRKQASASGNRHGRLSRSQLIRYFDYEPTRQVDRTDVRIGQTAYNRLNVTSCRFRRGTAAHRASGQPRVARPLTRPAARPITILRHAVVGRLDMTVASDQSPVPAAPSSLAARGVAGRH